MEAKEIESFLHLTAEAKDSWDQMCFSKCVDTFGLKLTDQQYECLSKRGVM